MSRNRNAMSGESDDPLDPSMGSGGGNLSPDGLVEVPIPGPLVSRKSRVVLAVAAVTVASAIAAFVIARGVPVAPLGITLLVLGTLLTALSINLSSWRTARLTRAAIDEAMRQPTDELVRAAIHRCGWNAGKCIRTMVEGLAAGGRTGTTIRICPETIADPIEPTRFAFEPRPLEHAHVGHDDSADPDGTERNAPPDDPAARTIRRNVLLKGGWLVFVPIGYIFSVETYRAIAGRQIDWKPFVLGATLLILLLVPVRSRGQCLLVPGGIIFRKSAWRSEKWNLHVFDRRESVLCVYRYWRRQWILTVADRHACETAMGTREEMHFLLPAWLSPLEPPGVEMLSDLA